MSKPNDRTLIDDYRRASELADEAPSPAVPAPSAMAMTTTPPMRVSSSFCSAVNMERSPVQRRGESLLSRRKRDQRATGRADMPAKQKIGIVGMGAAGWAFVPAIAGHAAFELAAITEPAADLRETVAKELGVAVYADLPSMLEKAALDAVYIATPTELHPEHCALAFAANKHVLTEKPMAVAIDQGRAMVEAAKRAYKEAVESYDPDQIVEAQTALNEAQWNLAEAKKFKPTPLQEPEFEVQTRHAEPEQVRPDEKTLRWQAKNQWFGANGFEEVTSYALGLHQKLVSSGTDPRSDEYFEQIDARVKSKFPEIFGGSDDKPRNGSSQRKPATVAAPATRSSGPRKVQLTETQRALARKFGLTDQQYALQVVKLEN